MKKSVIIVTIKNRLNHFLKTFPFLVSQYGRSYDLVLVDFHSNDNFQEHLLKEIEFRKDTFSPFLDKIKCVQLLEDFKFNPRKARNLGASYYRDKDVVFVFSDADVFLGMTYVDYWSEKIKEKKSFVATRIQDTKASFLTSRAHGPSRLKSEINYGNFLVHSDDYFTINGFDENVGHYGGDDDDIYHRLKLYGLREINPYNSNESRQYSIVHGDEERLLNLENPKRVKVSDAYNKIYDNTEFFTENSKFLEVKYRDSISKVINLYE
jgi:glycosyltransferase involved in cell wall biosynthesis